MDAYTSFAQVYDLFMDNVPYDEWCAYICETLKKHGIADGRCISLLKTLMTNCCIYDCKYCINRCTNQIKRATFTPREIADLTIQFYKRNYIEGLFLSSAVIKSPDYTMEQLYQAIFILRNEYHLYSLQNNSRL